VRNYESNDRAGASAYDSSARDDSFRIVAMTRQSDFTCDVHAGESAHRGKARDDETITVVTCGRRALAWDNNGARRKPMAYDEIVEELNRRLSTSFT
jgi:hypothetical protein